MAFRSVFALLTFSRVLVLSLDGDGDTAKFRKHYGLSFHAKCADYIKTFTCMSSCKSIGFQIFRLDYNCKCSCHELKTTTILPFFKWRTNGTTKAHPVTKSPHLYHVVGTMSPATYAEDEIEETEATSPSVQVTVPNADAGGNGTNSTEGDTTSPDGAAPPPDANATPGGEAPEGEPPAEEAPAEEAPAEEAPAEEPPAE